MRVGPAYVGTGGSFVDVFLLVVVLVCDINILLIATSEFAQPIDRSFTELELIVDEFSGH